MILFDDVIRLFTPACYHHPRRRREQGGGGGAPSCYNCVHPTIKTIIIVVLQNIKIHSLRRNLPLLPIPPHATKLMMMMVLFCIYIHTYNILLGP